MSALPPVPEAAQTSGDTAVLGGVLDPMSTRAPILETPQASGDGAVLKLLASDYNGSGLWYNPGRPEQPPAQVPEGVRFDELEGAFVFQEGGDVITVPLPTNPLALTEASFAAWVKLPRPIPAGNLGWLISQAPDYGWSRALTLGDYRLGHVSITTSHYWDSGLGPAPANRWIHIVGVWSEGENTVYIDGVRGGTSEANNGRGSDDGEVLVIGGRAPLDAVHNPAVAVSDVSVYGRALGDEEVQGLFAEGRRLAALTAAWRAVPGEPHVFRRLVSPLETPEWDDATQLFWFNTGVSAYELPDGSAWQEEFRGALDVAADGLAKAAASASFLGEGQGSGEAGGSAAASGQSGPLPKPARRVLQPTKSEATEPAARRPGRQLARHSSDPQRVAWRTSHSRALRQMTRQAGAALDVHGRHVALFRFGGRIFAVAAACPHQGGNLVEGEIGDIEDMVEGSRCYVTCPVHKFQFDLASGEVLQGKCGPLQTFAVRLRGDAGDRAEIEVGFDAAVPDCFAFDDEDDF